MIDIDVLGARGAESADVSRCEGILDALLSAGLTCAPRVVARLVTDVGSDTPTITEIMSAVNEDQRRGLRPLPDPLPLVRPIAEACADIRLAERDRTLLLAAALVLDDRLDPLLEFDGRSAVELQRGPLGAHLSLHAGRARLTDPRLGAHVRATAPPHATAEVHARLHRVFARRGEPLGTHWHAARGSVQNAPETAGVLGSLAQRASDAGSSDRALLLAAEAAEHCTGDAHHSAQTIAGLSAVASGYAAEAVTRLSVLFPSAAPRHRLRALSGMIVARTHLRGSVPAPPPTVLRRWDPVDEDLRSWVRAAACASVLCAEHGDRRGMRSWLEALRRATSADPRLRDLCDPVTELALLIAGDHGEGGAIDSGPARGGTRAALRAAIDGDVDGALRLLGSDDMMADAVDPFTTGFVRSPLVAAYRAVTEVLLLTWKGDIGLARERMLRSALDLPVTVPFAGLGVVLARRLDLHVLGELGPISRALSSALPVGIRLDRLVDRAVRAHLDGATDDAASLTRLWIEQGRPGLRFAVPGLEEISSTASFGPGGVRVGVAAPRAPVGPADHRVAAELFSRIASCPEDEWRTRHPIIAEAARSLSSPFLRGRVELMLSRRSLIRGDVADGVEHLRAARELLELSGAGAWHRTAAARLDRLVGAPGAGEPTPLPGSGCRQVWEPILTARELEVAMLAVNGASNRGIAEELHVSVRTVEVHLGRVFAKLGARGRMELTILAHRLDQSVRALAPGSAGE